MMFQMSSTKNGTTARVGVVVLGDLARSPRMKYHALSLLSHGFSVDMIGYQSSPLPHSIVSRARVTSLPPVPSCVSSLPRLASYLVKTVWQAVTLLLREGFKNSCLVN